jgi:ubiquinone biosynthesis monooxygenase Coq7
MMSWSWTDRLICAVDNALKTLTVKPLGTGRPMPGADLPETALTDQARQNVVGLMRVNHAGEIAAQALYQGQALVAQRPALYDFLTDAGRQEADHLRWTQERLAELNAKPSLLAPLWYAGAFCLGLGAARLGDGVSLGFLSETERQVEAHLKSHLTQLPEDDQRSRTIVHQMMQDEMAHGQSAREQGGRPLPGWAQAAMRKSAKVMTSTAYYV